MGGWGAVYPFVGQRYGAQSTRPEYSLSKGDTAIKIPFVLGQSAASGPGSVVGFCGLPLGAMLKLILYS